MSTTEPTKRRTITLTDRPPVTITEAAWPEIASASGDNYGGNEVISKEQADTWQIRVRQHADGRTIVYGTYREGWSSKHSGPTAAGELLSAPYVNTIVASIRTVAETLDLPARTVAACIAGLPPEELD